MINITCNNKEVRSGTCADIGDSNVVAYISFFDTINNTERKLYQPVYGDFKTSTAYLFDLSGNSITLTYADSNKTRTELEDLLVDCCGCVGGDGTVTTFSAGNLSPLFTTNVATPTTTPALSFNLSNCNQYQVFGRVVAGTGAPSYVPLNPIAFNGLAIPNREVVFGTGTGVSSSSGFKYTTLESVQIGTGTATGTYSFQMGAGSVASNYTMNIGGGIVNNRGNYSLIISESGSEISGSGSANLSVLLGGNNNKIIAGSYAYGNVIIGATNTVTSTTKTTTYNRILGNNNTITDAYYCNILGESNNITTSGAYEAYNNDIIGYLNNITSTTRNSYNNKILGVQNTIDSGYNVNIIGRYCNNGGYYGVMLLSDGVSSTLTATADNQFNSRFYGGYRFMQNGTTQWMAIANTGYVTINNIPTAASATDILVSNGGVVSTRTVASLGIPVITPAALTKTDDTNVTISLGGTPATALLQGVSLTMGWAGVLAISRGGTGLGSLGTANQLLRVNSGATALEYFTPTWTSNTGTVTSVAASISGTAITITGSPITTYGTLDFTWMGSIYQYVRGDGTLAYLPASANYLNDLLDVTITSPSTGQLLRYNGTEWVNWTPNFLTGNQTITLTGDVTGSGATSIVTTIAANAVTTSKIANTAVTFAKIQNINTNRLLGRSTAGSGSVEEISIGSGLSLSGGTLSASGGGGSAVWKVQGGSTDATTNTQNIYHNANVWLGDGSGSSSSYMLQVSGTSYLTGSVTLNNITSIQAWNNAASQQLKIAQLDSSNVFNYAENYLKIVGAGGNAGDITISAYPHTRKDTLSAYPRNVLVTNSSGNLLSLPGECYKNDNVNTTLSSDESHSADSTWRTVTWDTVNTPSWSHYGKDTTSGNMKMKLPTSTYEYGTHLIFVTINYTGGTSSEVNAEIRVNGSTVIGSATTNATASKNTLTFFTVIDNNSTYQGSVISLHIMVATGTGSITVKSGSKMVMIAAGAPLPA